MSRQRRNFSAKFKSDLVIELLKGEKDLNTLATENNIQPNLLRNWKKIFIQSLRACTIISVKSLCFSSIVISTDALAYIILEHEEKNTMTFLSD